MWKNDLIVLFWGLIRVESVMLLLLVNATLLEDVDVYLLNVSNLLITGYITLYNHSAYI